MGVSFHSVARIVWLTAMSVWLLASSVARAQYYDSTAVSAAEGYLAGVEGELGGKALPSELRADALALASTFGALDRISIPAAVFVEHLVKANEVKKRFYPDMPDEAFRKYVLPIRIRYESTARSGWRAGLLTETNKAIAGSSAPEEAAVKVLSWVSSKVKITGPARAYSLGLKGDMDPVSTFRAGAGSEVDVSILAVAALRSAGIAARLTYAPAIREEAGGKVWVEYRCSKGWKPWVPSGPARGDHLEWLKREFGSKLTYVLINPADPVNVTPDYTKAIPVWMAPHPLDIPDFVSNAMLLSGGRLQPLMGRDIYTLEPRWATLGFGVGTYVLLGGDKTSSLGMKPVTIGAGQPGWYLTDFTGHQQFFAQSATRPQGFEWEPPEVDSPPAEW